MSDTEVQRCVVTLARQTPEREWLGEVASVALLQACQDARRAYRNWFDSPSGYRKGRRVGAPRFRSKRDDRQSVRLTRNGFALRGNGRVYFTAGRESNGHPVSRSVGEHGKIHPNGGQPPVTFSLAPAMVDREPVGRTPALLHVRE